MIDLGSVVQIAVDVRDAAGALTNPASATLTITLPDGTTATPAVGLPPTATGQLRVDYVTGQPGRHSWRMVTTSPTTAYTDVFNVAPAAPPAMMSLADAKKHLNIPATTTTDDDELRGYLSAATLAVERARGEIVVRRTFTDDFQLSAPTAQILLTRVPVVALTSVQAVDAATTWTVGNLDADAGSGVVTVKSGAAFSGWLRVVYEAGYPVIPDGWLLAGEIILQHLWETQRGTSVGVSFGGGEQATPFGMGFAIPNRALELLGPQLPGVA